MLYSEALVEAREPRVAVEITVDESLGPLEL
jgi:hypothetical protein